MAFKMFLLAALVSCASALYAQRPQSAASPSQIAYAMSQNYDQTGPGAHLPLVQQETATTPQEQQAQQQFNRPQAYQQQGFTVQQQYANQPQPYNNQQEAYAPIPQAYADQPQVYSSQQHPQLSYAQPQVAFSHASPSYAPVAQPSQISHSQVSYPQAAPVSYSHVPHIVYSSSPHMLYPPQPAQVLKATTLKAVQPEVYDANPQYAFTYNTQHEGAAGDSKGQEELHQGAYPSIGAEGHRESDNAYGPVLHRQPPPENFISGHQQQAYLAPAVKPIQFTLPSGSPVAQQFYAGPSKNVYPAPTGSRNSLLSGPKNLYSSYLSKFSSPLSQ